MDKICPSKYIKICKDCWATFRTEKKHKQYCPDCAARRIKESKLKCPSYNQAGIHSKPKGKKNAVKKPALSITQICRLQKLYNEDNKTLLNYGDIVQKIDTGKIEVTVTNGVISYVQKD